MDKPDPELYEKKVSAVVRMDHASRLFDDRELHLNGIIKELETTIREHQKHNKLIEQGICPTCGGEVCGEKVDTRVLERSLTNYRRALEHLHKHFQQVFADHDK